ncbi:MAG TPA: hypothetical protein RMG45_27630, partial [Polyangiaceae bacterium LLY-WYZ-15_(1-7)]|nr:hypothetical protein [Polyangiaceae bacterium LLY-WYZ-15_(1-7)]
MSPTSRWLPATLSTLLLLGGCGGRHGPRPEPASRSEPAPPPSRPSPSRLPPSRLPLFVSVRAATSPLRLVESRAGVRRVAWGGVRAELEGDAVRFAADRFL